METCKLSMPSNTNNGSERHDSSDDVILIEPQKEADSSCNAFNPSICRLCLVEITNQSHNNKLEGIAKNMLEIIIPELNSTLCNSTIICNNCDKTLQDTYTFKSACLEIEDKIQDFVDPTSPGLLTLEEILDQKDSVESPIYSKIANNEKICRTCLNIVDENGCTNLYNFDGDPLKDMLEKCIPEMITNLTKMPVICSICLESLENQFHFVMQCLDSEEKINYYCEKFNCKDNIDLYQVFIFSMNVEEDQHFFENNFIRNENKNEENNDENLGNSSKTTNFVRDIKTTNSDESNKDCLNLDNDDKTGNKIIDCEVYSLSSESDSEASVTSNSLLSVTNVVDVNEDKVEKKEEMVYKESDQVKDDQPNYKEDDLSDDEQYRPFNKRRRTFKCPICSFKARYKTRINTHLEETHKINKEEQISLKCKAPNCDFSTTDKTNLKVHIKSSHPDLFASHSCPNCSISFVRKGNLDKHLMHCIKVTKKNDKKDIKTPCNYGTKKCYRFDKHMLTMYKCKVCPYQTRMKCNFDKHSQSHKKSNAVKVFKCKACSFQTVKKDAFATHLESHIESINDKFRIKCFLCSFETHRSDSFKKHMMEHKTQDPI